MSAPYADQPGNQPTQPAQGAPFGNSGYYATPPKPKNGMGTAALVLGILAVLTVWIPVLGGLLGLLALIFGILGRSRVKKGVATNGGAALTGLILGVLTLIVNIVLSIVVGASVFALFQSGSVEQLQQCVATQQSQGADAATAGQVCAQQIQQQIQQQAG